MTFRTLKYKRLMVRLRRSEKGQSLVEIALTLPVLATLLLGAAEFARVAYAAIEVSNAAKAGVAYAAQNASNATDTGSATSGIIGAATLDAGNITLNLQTATPPGVTVTVTGVCSSGAACTGTGNTCLNTDCQNPANPNDHIETIVSVDTATTYTPAIHVPGFPASYTLRGHATQICLP